MPNKPKIHKPPGTPTKQQVRKEYDRRRGNSHRAIYTTAWWRETRVRVANRDGWQCVECNVDVGKAKRDFECDHKEPRPVGAPIDMDGCDRDENLQTLCVRCHARKRAKEGAAKVNSVSK